MKLTDYAVLTFDCYGTLIDWETGLFAALGPLIARSGVKQTRDEVLEAFGRREAAQQALTPKMPYAALLAEVHGQFATGWGVARDSDEDVRFGQSVADWPAFDDTAEALIYLKQHFQLVILSNVDQISFNATNRHLGVVFDAIYTAQDIGCYKPDRRTFAYLLDQMAKQGIMKDQVLHVAQSLFHDHVPANALGITSAWIDRRSNVNGWGATAPVSDQVRYTYRFNSLREFTQAHKAQENTL